MTNHRLIVSCGFQACGLSLAVVAGLAALGCTAMALRVGLGAPKHAPQYLDVGHYGVAGLLSNAATGAGSVLSLLNGFATVVFGLAAVAALVIALAGGLTYLVGRGLRASAGWARILGTLLSVFSVFNCLVALALLHGAARLVDGLALTIAAYVIWVLVRRYDCPSRTIDREITHSIGHRA